MDANHFAQLVSAILGVAGTALLFFCSFADRPTEGAVFNSDPVRAANARITAQNIRDGRLRRIGFALLCMSFAIQAWLAVCQ